MRRVIVSFLLALFIAAPASAASIDLAMDEVKMITFSKPVATVYVGNPVVADVNMVDTRRAFVLGKSFGATNIIALDASGNQVANSEVTVLGRNASTVTLNRGAAQVTLTCAGRCEPAPKPGDNKEEYDSAIGQIRGYQSMGKEAANQ